MKALIPALLLLLSLSAAAQNSIPPPDGWKQQVQGTRHIFSPNTLLQTHFTYSVMSPEKNVNDELTDWLDKTAEKNIQADGYTISPSANTQRKTVQAMNIYGTYAADQAGK